MSFETTFEKWIKSLLTASRALHFFAPEPKRISRTLYHTKWISERSLLLLHLFFSTFTTDTTREKKKAQLSGQHFICCHAAPSNKQTKKEHKHDLHSHNTHFRYRSSAASTTVFTLFNVYFGFSCWCCCQNTSKKRSNNNAAKHLRSIFYAHLKLNKTHVVKISQHLLKEFGCFGKYNKK